MLASAKIDSLKSKERGHGDLSPNIPPPVDSTYFDAFSPFHHKFLQGSNRALQRSVLSRTLLTRPWIRLLCPHRNAVCVTAHVLPLSTTLTAKLQKSPFFMKNSFKSFPP